MNERELSRNVVRLAELLGYRVFTINHTRAAGLRSHGGLGFPDLVCVRGGRMLAVELKVKGRRPTSHQLEWLRLLGEVEGVEAHLWNEGHWHDGTVEAVFRSNAPAEEVFRSNAPAEEVLARS